MAMMLSNVLIAFAIATLALATAFSEATRSEHSNFLDGSIAQSHEVRSRRLNGYIGTRIKYRSRFGASSSVGRVLEESCSPDQQLCGITCVDLNTSVEHCGSCSSLCATSQSCCAGSCVDTTSDANNCGACGKSCASRCVSGMCGY